jgi:DNA-binding MarR family transcriptional regulator
MLVSMQSGSKVSFISQEESLMDQIEDCLSFYLGKAYQRVAQSAKQRLAPYGVTPVQYALLKVLWERDQQSGAELSDRLLLDSATMTGLLDRLEHAGLIERQAHATDRRVNRVALTARGRDLQVPLDREMDQLNQGFLGEFTPEERRLLRNLLVILSGRKQVLRTTDAYSQFDREAEN